MTTLRPAPFDVAVAGAGPAGAAAAITLAQRGHRVLVLDRDRFPRRKVCGSCLNTGCRPVWDELGFTGHLDTLPHHRIPALHVEWGEHRVTAPISHDEVALDRKALDQSLLEHAASLGVTFLDGTSLDAARYEAPEGLWTLDTSAGSVAARVLVGADGRRSRVARLTGLTRPPGTCRRTGWQATLDAPGSSAVRMRFFNEGYFGLTPLGDGRLNVAMVLHRQTPISPQAVFERETGHCIPESDWKAIAPITRADNHAHGHRVLLCGDALRVVEPFTGEGIYFALRSGIAAGRACDFALSVDNAWTEAAWRYDRELYDIYLPRLWFNRAVRFICEHPRAARWLVRALHGRGEWLSVLARPVLRPA
jgi:geranylgeranyl reductase family protein